jgi:uncharacterized Zn finger protein/DNA-binding transcriptional regulator YiaG
MIDGIVPYETVAERRAKADRVLAELSRTFAVQPVRLEGGAIARSFWGRTWSSHMESLPGVAKRKRKGCNYVRNNAVCHLEISAGTLTAKVSGKELYDVEVKIETIPENVWANLAEKTKGLIHNMTELLSGKISRPALKILRDPLSGFLPKQSDFRPRCTCSTNVDFCPHVTATLYGVANRLDRYPAQLFLLRGVDPDDLVTRGPAPEQGDKPEFSRSDAGTAKDAESAAFSLNNSTAVVLRRRDGQERRLELKAKGETSPEAAGPDTGGPTDDQTETRTFPSRDPDAPVTREKKAKPFRIAVRRRRTGWVPVVIEKDDDSPEPGASGLALPEMGDYPRKTVGDSPAERKKADDREPAGGRAKKTARGGAAKSVKYLDHPSSLASLKAELPAGLNPGVSRDSVFSLDGFAEIRKHREKRLKTAIELINGATMKKLRKHGDDSSAENTKKKLNVAAARRKAVRLAALAERDEEAMRKAARRYPESLKTDIPTLDFEKVTGKHIRALRKSVGWSLEAFSDNLGICKATVDRWENSKGTLSLYTPSVEALRKLYKAIVRRYNK